MKTRTASIVLLALAIPLLLDSPSFATDRFYRDQSVVSPSGRYQLDAKSPDNAGDRPKPFARNFTYTLRDTKTDEIVWTRAQREGSPVEASMRRAVHLALRRLGEKPRELPCTWFRYTRADGIGDYVELSDRTVPRVDCVEFVKAGMTPKELLDTIGAPDLVNFGEEAWEYDMDAEKPYTLRVYWKDKKVVDRTERIMPAVWQHGETRYHQLNGW